MSLLDTLRAGVAVADGVTKSVQTTVSVERYAGSDGYGSDYWFDPVFMKASCDWKQSTVPSADGILVAARVTVTFTDIKEMQLKTEGKGIGQYDKITLPDGTTGPILGMEGFVDAGTTKPLATDVHLGK